MLRGGMARVRCRRPRLLRGARLRGSPGCRPPPPLREEPPGGAERGGAGPGAASSPLLPQPRCASGRGGRGAGMRPGHGEGRPGAAHRGFLPPQPSRRSPRSVG